MVAQLHTKLRNITVGSVDKKKKNIKKNRTKHCQSSHTFSHNSQ